ncbi:hypothetical protein OHC33_006896 [Knufia fluminis]|uniref:Uncharacterized protein n=1 Tax=Knufia fluminis TaxID=191047 RepID=A0AAN8I6Y0_9EURO|nr:hypothetical protein OHC33_006896 [Knufia fluminis]
MCSEQYLPYLILDYTRSIADIYTAATRAAINVEQSLAIFSQIRPSKKGPKDLPSWVPDLRERRTYGQALGLSSPEGKRYFDASDHRRPHIVETSSPRRIGLRGIKLGQVTRTIDPQLFRISSLQDWDLSDDRFELSNWREIFRQGALRLNLPSSCIRTQDFFVGLSDDILFHRDEQLLPSIDKLLAIALRRTLTADAYPHPFRSRTPKQKWEAEFPDYAIWAMNGSSFEIPREVVLEHDLYIAQVLHKRSLYIVGQEPDDVFLCIASIDVRLGDWACILDGGDMPVILRPRTPCSSPQQDDEGQTWEFLCEAYLDGIMDGEVIYSAHTAATFILD